MASPDINATPYTIILPADSIFTVATIAQHSSPVRKVEGKYRSWCLNEVPVMSYSSVMGQSCLDKPNDHQVYGSVPDRQHSMIEMITRKYDNLRSAYSSTSLAANRRCWIWTGVLRVMPNQFRRNGMVVP
jgi:hypothetical protein